MATLLDVFNVVFKTEIEPTQNRFASVIDGFERCTTKEHAKLVARCYQSLYQMTFFKTLQYAEAWKVIAKASGLSINEFSLKIKKKDETDTIFAKIGNELWPKKVVKLKPPMSGFERFIDGWHRELVQHSRPQSFNDRVEELYTASTDILREVPDNKQEWTKQERCEFTHIFCLAEITNFYLNKPSMVYRITNTFGEHLYTENIKISKLPTVEFFKVLKTVSNGYFCRWLEMPKFYKKIYNISGVAILASRASRFSKYSDGILLNMILIRNDGSELVARLDLTKESISALVDKNPEFEFIFKCLYYLITGKPDLEPMEDFDSVESKKTKQKYEYEEPEVKIIRISYKYARKKRKDPDYDTPKWSVRPYVNKKGTLVINPDRKRNPKLLNKNKGA